MSRLGIALLALVVGMGFLALPAQAEKVNCANEFRSGKLYFTQAMKDQELYLFYKAVDRFALSVETCPEKAEYHGRYAMSLAQLANVKLGEELPMLPTPEEREALVDSALILYGLSGTEFDASMEADPSKSNLKFVRENREYYWVNRYNEGLKRLNDEEDMEAILRFRMALLVDPNSTLIDKKSESIRNSKAYANGAIAYINIGNKMEAARWVQSGLEKDAEDEKLNELLNTIYVDVGRDLMEQAKTDKDLKKIEEAAQYFTEVNDRRGGKDPDVLFDRGLTYLAGAAIAEGEPAKEMAVLAAGDFEKAAVLVPAEDEKNRDFHMATLFNLAQSRMDAGDFEAAVNACRQYIALDCADPSIWLLTAQAASSRDDQDQAVAALMASKSIQGGEVPVADAKKAATGEEATSATELGDPTFVFSYQDAQQNVVNTWLWCQKKTIRNFILGDKVGELVWSEAE